MLDDTGVCRLGMIHSKIREERYIAKRKRMAWGNSVCFFFCRIFPVKKNLISVCTFEGKGGFGCNPKYLVEELHRRNPEYEFAWFVNDMEKDMPDYIRKVPNTLLNRAYWLSRSKVWIDNYRKPYGTIKRKGQYYLNTNHYTVGIKCTGLWRGDGFSRMAYLVSKNDSDMMDDLVIDSDWCEIVSPKGLVYDGSYLKTGAPRCDVLYGDRSLMRQAFREKHNLPEEAKVLLFAPTFREGAKDGVRSVYSEIWSIDFKRLVDNLEVKFGGKWYICVRVHPQLAPSFANYHNPDVENRIINESQADDMYEILAGMDAYISDYSSACFEAGFAKIPVFIYAADIADYANARGEMMWNLAPDPLDTIHNNQEITPQYNLQFPFTVATDNDELECHIQEFDPAAYSQKLDDFHKAIGLVFVGNASGRVADKVQEKMQE